MDLSTALSILGLDHNCTQQQVRDAYLDLVKVWHPDRFPADSRLRAKAEEKLKEINQAYKLLSSATSSTARQSHTPAHEPAAPQSPPGRSVDRDQDASSESVASRLLDRWASMSTAGRWGVVLAALWMGFVVLESLFSLNPATPRTTARPRQSVPAATEGRVPTATVSSASRENVATCDQRLTITPPKSGVEIGGRHRGGLGSLRIKNGSESDAIAVVVDESTGIPKRAIYIRRDETGVMTSMPVGRYRVLFQTGETWLQSKRFCHIASTAQFENVLEFEERDSGDRTEYSRFELTLYAVAGGNARTDSLPNTPLALPDP